MPDKFDLDAGLVRLSPWDCLTSRDVLAGLLAIGATGAGKSSSTAKIVRRAILKSGWGLLNCCAKPDEVDACIADARAVGRERSVIVFDETQSFNFLNHELSRGGPDAVGNAARTLTFLAEISRGVRGSGAANDNDFWSKAEAMALGNVVPLLHAAHGTVQVADIKRFVQSVPTSEDQLRDQEWRERSYAFCTIEAAARRPVRQIDHADLWRVLNFWRHDWFTLDPKTRTNIAITLAATLDPLLRGRLNRAYASATSLTPELLFHGAIIILAMPSLTWGEEGRIAQQLFKYMAQRAILARNELAPEHRERPVAIFADECQEFVNSFDAEFAATSRSSRGTSIYLTQSLAALYARMGGERAKYAADSLTANFGVKVLHALAEPDSARWAADLVGRSLQRRGSYSEGRSAGWSAGMNAGESVNSGRSYGSSVSSDGKGNSSFSSNSGSTFGAGETSGRSRGFNSSESATEGYSLTMDWELEPNFFSRHLRTGGPANGGIVDAVWFQAGRRFESSGTNWLPVSFKQ